MEIHTEIAALSTRAYGLFVSELTNHVAALKALCERGAVCPEVDLGELRNSMHKVKGGAGFFGLNQVACQAAELEGVLLKPVTEVQKQLDGIRDLVKRLDACLQELPAPKKQVRS